MQLRKYRWQIPIVCVCYKWGINIGLRKLVYITFPRKLPDPDDSQFSFLTMLDEGED